MTQHGGRSTFGHAGTRIVHRSAAAAAIHAADGRRVVCSVDVTGALASFVFACEHRTLYEPGPPPRARYEWSASDVDAQAADVHTLDLRFTGATAYHYRMHVVDRAGAVVETLKDIEYESSDSRDFYLEPIRLRIDR